MTTETTTVQVIDPYERLDRGLRGKLDFFHPDGVGDTGGARMPTRAFEYRASMREERWLSPQRQIRASPRVTPRIRR